MSLRLQVFILPTLGVCLSFSRLPSLSNQSHCLARDSLPRICVPRVPARLLALSLGHLTSWLVVWRLRLRLIQSLISDVFYEPSRQALLLCQNLQWLFFSLVFVSIFFRGGGQRSFPFLLLKQTVSNNRIILAGARLIQSVQAGICG